MTSVSDLALPPAANTVTAMPQIVLRLTSGTAPILGMVVPGKGRRFSVFDFMCNTFAWAGKSCVKMAFAKLISDGSEHKEEVVKLIDYLKFPGACQRETLCMSITGLQRLLALLGSKIGQQYPELATNTLTRVATGDTSLIEEIEDNTVGDSAIREALAVPLSLGDGGGAPSAVTGADAEGDELSEEVLGRVAGINIKDLDNATRPMMVFIEERRDVKAVLKGSVPLIERDIQFGRDRLQLDKDQAEFEAQAIKDRAEFETQMARAKAEMTMTMKRKREWEG